MFATTAHTKQLTISIISFVIDYLSKFDLDDCQSVEICILLKLFLTSLKLRPCGRIGMLLHVQLAPEKKTTSGDNGGR